MSTQAPSPGIPGGYSPAINFDTTFNPAGRMLTTGTSPMAMGGGGGSLWSMLAPILRQKQMEKAALAEEELKAAKLRNAAAEFAFEQNKQAAYEAKNMRPEHAPVQNTWKHGKPIYVDYATGPQKVPGPYRVNPGTPGGVFSGYEDPQDSGPANSSFTAPGAAGLGPSAAGLSGSAPINNIADAKTPPAPPSLDNQLLAGRAYTDAASDANAQLERELALKRQLAQLQGMYGSGSGSSSGGGYSSGYGRG